MTPQTCLKYKGYWNILDLKIPLCKLPGLYGFTKQKTTCSLQNMREKIAGCWLPSCTGPKPQPPGTCSNDVRAEYAALTMTPNMPKSVLHICFVLMHETSSHALSSPTLLPRPCLNRHQHRRIAAWTHRTRPKLPQQLILFETIARLLKYAESDQTDVS